ncbi:hypothetical protein DJ71_25035 [Halorubrum sp. E3]|nr:hypothetical protein DJ71_25035 [Halorubrum sp. E3]
MVSIAQVVGGLLTFQLLSCLWIWRETRNLRDDYGDDFDELMLYRASQFRGELHEIIMNILEDIDYDELQDAEDPDALVYDATEGINRDSLTDVEKALRRYDKPTELVDQIEEKYWSFIKNSGVAAVMLLIFLIGTISIETADTRAVVQFLFGLFWLIFTIDGVQAWKTAFGCERKVDKAIRDYQNDY